MITFVVITIRVIRMESKRQLQVAELIKRNFGTVLQEKGMYIFGEAFVTITAVKLTPDLSMAKLYFSIFNTEDKNEVILLMRKNMHTLKQALVTRIRKHVRRIPYLAFFEDETLDEMYKLNKLFDRLNKREEE